MEGTIWTMRTKEEIELVLEECSKDILDNARRCEPTDRNLQGWQEALHWVLKERE